MVEFNVRTSVYGCQTILLADSDTQTGGWELQGNDPALLGGVTCVLIDDTCLII